MKFYIIIGGWLVLSAIVGIAAFLGMVWLGIASSGRNSIEP